MAAMLGDVRQMMGEAGISAPLRFAAALADGKTIYAFRYSSDNRPRRFTSTAVVTALSLRRSRCRTGRIPAARNGLLCHQTARCRSAARTSSSMRYGGAGRHPQAADDFWFIALNSGAYGWSPVPSKTIQDAFDASAFCGKPHAIGANSRSFLVLFDFRDETAMSPVEQGLRQKAVAVVPLL